MSNNKLRLIKGNINNQYSYCVTLDLTKLAEMPTLINIYLNIKKFCMKVKHGGTDILAHENFIRM